MSVKSRGMGGGEYTKNGMSRNMALMLCLCSFFAGMVFTNRMWTVPEGKDEDAQINLKSENYPQLDIVQHNTNDSMGSLDNTISKLEMKLTAARAEHESIMRGNPKSANLKKAETNVKRNTLWL